MRIHWFAICLVAAGLAVGMAGCAKRPNSETPAPPPASAQNPPDSSAGGEGANPSAREVQPDPVVDRSGWPVIVALGDSLTAGYNVADDQSYPSQLQVDLDRLGYEYRVVNTGISGDTTAGGLARVDTVLKHNPEIVIIALGANDALRGLSTERMKANLSEIIRRLQGAGARVVLAGMKAPPNMGPDYTTQFEEVFGTLARENGLPLVPFLLEGVAAKPELNLRDGIHPTGEGYRIVVQNVWKELSPILSH